MQWSVETTFLLEADSEQHAREKMREYLSSLGDHTNDERIAGIVLTATVKPAEQLDGPLSASRA